MSDRDRTGELIDSLKTELDALNGRLAVDGEAMGHLYEIYRIAFCCWYDPDSEAHAKVGREIWPHISALNSKLKFKR